MGTYRVLAAPRADLQSTGESPARASGGVRHGGACARRASPAAHRFTRDARASGGPSTAVQEPRPWTAADLGPRSTSRHQHGLAAGRSPALGRRGSSRARRGRRCCTSWMRWTSRSRSKLQKTLLATRSPPVHVAVPEHRRSPTCGAVSLARWCPGGGDRQRDARPGRRWCAEAGRCRCTGPRDQRRRCGRRRGGQRHRSPPAGPSRRQPGAGHPRAAAPGGGRCAGGRHHAGLDGAGRQLTALRARTREDAVRAVVRPGAALAVLLEPSGSSWQVREATWVAGVVLVLARAPLVLAAGAGRSSSRDRRTRDGVVLLVLGADANVHRTWTTAKDRSQERLPPGTVCWFLCD
jgi:hypothetical protein